jgi:hypothetical protein
MAKSIVVEHWHAGKTVALTILAAILVALLASFAGGVGFGVGVEEAQAAPSPIENPTIRFVVPVVGHAAIDPIRDPPPDHAHNHVFVCNPTVQADSTAESLAAWGETCSAPPWASQSYWFPEVYEQGSALTVSKTVLYYVGLGDQSTMEDMPFGAQLIGDTTNGMVRYACGETIGARENREGSAAIRPPYYCNPGEYFRVRVDFPDCWDGSELTPEHFRFAGEAPCPADYPHKLPDSLISIQYANPDGLYPRKLRVSTGTNERRAIRYFMHADAFEAFQPEFISDLHRCIRDQPDNAVAPPGCISRSSATIPE